MTFTLNDYSYLVDDIKTPNETKYNFLVVNPMVKYGEKYSNMLFDEIKPLNFEYEENCSNILKELIEENKIVLVGVDLFYWIPNSVCWNKHGLF